MDREPRENRRLTRLAALWQHPRAGCVSRETKKDRYMASPAALARAVGRW